MALRLLTTGISNPEPQFYKEGTATIPAGSVSVVVPHDLAMLPTRIEVVPDCNITTVTDTSFTISILYPQSADTVFSWTASPSTEFLNTGNLDGGSTTRKNLIQYRRSNTATWTSVNPVLSEGEPAYDTDLKELRIGDGTSPYASLTPLNKQTEVARTIEGVLYTTTFLPHVVTRPGIIRYVRSSVVSLPVGADILIDVRKNGTYVTDSIFTNDTPIKIKQMISTTYRLRSSNTATLTIPGHSYQVGDSILVSGVSGTGYNGTYTITFANSGTIQYACTGTDEASTADTGGIVTIAPTNGLYQVKTSVGNTVSLDATRTSVVEGDVIWMLITQVGSTIGGIDLINQLVIS